MRLELLLIFGILFFCCWCAFIVARMNWSVALPPPPPPPPLPPSTQSEMGAKGGRPDVWRTAAASAVAPVVQSPSSLDSLSQQQHQQQQQQQIDLLAGNQGQPPAQLYWPPGEPSFTQTNSSHWRHLSQHQPSAHMAAPSAWFGRQLEPAQATLTAAGGGPAQMYTAVNNNLQAVEEQPQGLQWPPPASLEQPVDQAEDASASGGPEEEADSANDNNQEEQQPQAEDEDQQQQQQDQPMNEAEEEEEQPPTDARERLEELSERRSFNEDQTDSSERDRDGNTILTKRSHLINGKPVRGPPPPAIDRRNGQEPLRRPDENEQKFDRDDEAEEGAEEEDNDGNVDHDGILAAQVDVEGHQDEVARKRQQQEREFDRVVKEIDRESAKKKKKKSRTNMKKKKKKGKGEEETAASTTSSRNSSLTSRPRDNSISRRIMTGGGGSDDDADSNDQEEEGEAREQPESAQTSITAKNRHLPSIRPADLHEHRLQETLSAQQWDDDSPEGANKATPQDDHQDQDQDQNDDDDSPVDDEGLPDIVDQDEEARKLQQLSRELLSSAPSPPDDDDENKPLDRRRRQVAHSDVSRIFTLNSSETITTSTTTTTTTTTPMPQLDASLMFINVSANLGRPSNEQRTTNESQFVVSSPLDSLEVAANGAKSNADADANAEDILTGQEDISIEVLADRPRANNLTNGLPYSYLAAGPQPPPVALTYQQSSFPQVGWPVASGSGHSKSIKKKSTKKKKASAKKMKTKGNTEKYRSAKAHAKKMRSKQKKGKSHKKKHKENQKFSANKKHFKGHSRGSKDAKGLKLNGANKGSDFFKDKGYKKRGFKKVYHKLESGDHKTYFDEFHDKDHKKKWKKFNDKARYDKHKKWSGGDQKQLKEHKYHLDKGKSQKDGQFKEKHSSKYSKKGHKLKKAKRLEDSHGLKKKRKKKTMETKKKKSE